MSLSNEEKLKFSNIMFKSEGRERDQISRLNEDELQKLKGLYAQKIAYDTVNGHIQPPPEYAPENRGEHAPKPGIISSLCCCFFPENNRENFDITTSTFLKRVFSTFLLWKNNFLEIGDGKTEFYGPMWLTFTYIIILGLAANLNEYFIMPQNYVFDNQFMIKALGITLIFKLAEPFIYSAVIKCLGGLIPSNQSIMLTGYSVVLYFIPVLLCLIPSLYWHMGMLITAAVLRGFFLFRNYSSKLQSKTYIMLVVILLIEAFFFYILLKTMFNNDFGYTLNDGTKRVFKHQITLRTFSDSI